MKKLLMALLGLGLVLSSATPVLAWSKANFGAGFNWGWEGGGNSVFWGLIKGANIPGAPDSNEGGGLPDIDLGQMIAPQSGGHGAMPGTASEPNAVPRTMPSTMPRADAQPVGYFQQNAGRQQAPQYAPASDYAAPSYWYDR